MKSALTPPAWTHTQSRILIALLVISACPLLLLAMRYAQIEPTIAIHFNLHGGADRWASKAHLWWIAILFSISCVAPIAVMLWTKAKYNYPIAVNEHNLEAVHRATQWWLIGTMATIALSCLGLFTDLLQVALQQADQANLRYLWAMLAVLPILMMAYFSYCWRLK